MTRIITIAILLATIAGIGTLAFEGYTRLTRFAESVSYPERVSRSIR